MATVSLTKAPDYATQLAELLRRQKEADELQQEARQPLEAIGSYKGIQAPISPLAGLAKMLDAYSDGREEHDIPAQQEALKDKARSAATDWLSGFGQTTAPAPAGPSPADIASAGPTQAQGPNVAQAMGQGMDASGPPQSFGNPLARALAQSGGVIPTPNVQIPQQTLSHAAMSPEDQRSQAMMGMTSGNPFISALAPDLYKSANEQVQKVADLKDAAAQKEADRQADVAKASQLVNTLPGLSDDKRAWMASIASVQGTAGLKPALDEIAKANFTPQDRVASPQEVAAFGLPQGALVKIDPVKGPEIVYNPSADKARDAELKLSQARLGEEQRHNHVTEANGGGVGGAWALTPEEQGALNKAVGENRVDLKGINSRSAKIVASALVANPGMSAIDLHAISQLSANGPTQRTEQLVNILPTVVGNVAEAGKKLNFPDFQFAGKLQAFQKGQLNDPDFINYMTQRNDAVQSLSQVMRGVGATDLSTKLESDAAPVTMSPKAFDAWYRAQMTALQPRIDQYKKFQIGGGHQTGGFTSTSDLRKKYGLQ